MIYAFNLVLLLPLGYYSSRHRNIIGFYLFCLSIYFVFFFGSYYKIGGDWLAYQYIYDDPEAYILEPLYKRLLIISKVFSNSNVLLNLLISLIFLLSIFSLVDHPRDLFLVISWNLSYLLPVVLIGYNRQALAISFVYFILATWRRRKSSYIKKLAFPIAAVASHLSAAFAVTLLVLIRNKIFLIIMLVFIYLLQAKISGLYFAYTNYGTASKGFHMRVFANFFILLALWYSFPGKPPERSLYILLLTVIMFFLLCNMLAPLSVLFDRLNIYITAIISVLVGSVSKKLRETSAKKWKWFSFSIWLYSLFLISVWLVYADNANAWLPYRNVLFEILL